MAESDRISLLPLNAVLFPYSQIIIHIFEERYHTMILDCLNREATFGIVLIREGVEVGGYADPYLVGTTARIVSSDVLGDGSLNLRIQGERRFRIRRLDDSLPYLVGDIVPIRDSDHMEALDLERAAVAKELFAEWVQTQISQNGTPVQVRLPDDALSLSFAIANFLPLDNLERQRLLEITDTGERLSIVIPELEEQLAQMAQPKLVKLTAQDLADAVSNN